MLSSHLLKQRHLQRSLNTLRVNSSIFICSQKPLTLQNSFKNATSLYPVRQFSKVRSIKGTNISSVWNIDLEKQKMTSNYESYVL